MKFIIRVFFTIAILMSSSSLFSQKKIVLDEIIGVIGDEIVTNGTFTVDAAAQLQGKKSMMNKQGGKTMTGHEVKNTDIFSIVKKKKLREGG